MIQNEHQYKVTTGEIDKLQQAINKLLEQQNIPPSQLAAMQNSFQTQIDRMQMEIQAYEDSQIEFSNMTNTITQSQVVELDPLGLTIDDCWN